MRHIVRIVALLMAALMVVTSCQAPDSGSQLTDGIVDVSFAGPSARTITTDDGLVQTVATSDLWFEYKAEWKGSGEIPTTAKNGWTRLSGRGLAGTIKLHRGTWGLSLRAFVNENDIGDDGKFILSGTLPSVEIGANNLVTQTVSINLGYVRQEGNGTLHVSATYPVVYHETDNPGSSPVEAVRKVKVTANVAGTDYTGEITAFDSNNVGVLDLTVPAGAAHVTVQYYMDDSTLFEDDKTAKDVLIMATMTTNLAVSVDRDITAVTFKAEQPEGTVEDNVIPKVFNSIFDIYPGNLRNNEVVIGYAEETKALGAQTPITYPYEICTAAEKDEKGRYIATSLGLTPIIVTNQTALKDSGATAIWRGPGSFNFTETNEFVKEVHFSDNASSSGGGYSYLTNLKKVVIGNGFTGIGSGAFKNCKNLTEVVIPDSVRSLGYVNKSSSSPSGDGAFQGCTSLETINLPEGLITIGDNTFLGCSSIDNIIIPLTVTEFGEDAFHGCSSLTSIIIPEGVETLSEWMFYGCTNLESVILPETLTTIGFGAFQNCEKIESINIPSNVSKISAQAFLGCKGITSVTIPSGATITGHSAFSGCLSLESVIFCDGVTSTGDQTFEHCSSLTSVILPDSITYIGNNTFSNGCYGLSSSSITIPENITTLYSSAIQPGCAVVYKGTVEQWNSKKLDTGDRRDIQCTNGKPLMRIYYDKSSGETYFRGLTPYGEEIINTEETLIIPDGVTIISAPKSFKNCSVKKLVVPTSVQRIFSNLFADAKTAVELINYNGTVDEWLSIRMGTGLPSNINISCSDGYVPCIIYTPFPEGSDTQSYWDKLTVYGKTFTEVTFSNRSPRIGSYVLSGSYNSSNNIVEKVIVEEGVTKIDSCAFANCSNLSEIILPSTITSIGSEIFKNSNNVSNIYINMSQEGHETLFDNAAIPSGCTITWNSTGSESV